MKKTFLMFFVLCFILVSCSAHADDPPDKQKNTAPLYEVSFLTDNSNSFLKAIWLTQFDLHPIFRDGKKQREQQDFCVLAEQIFENISQMGFDTVFLQARPNGDSFFETELYPTSKYVSGILGGELEYDPLEILVTLAKKHNLSVHGWINPLRLSSVDDAESLESGYFVYDAFKSGDRMVKQCGEMLFLDPSYKKAIEHICMGADELLKKYDFDGLHIDDYFYPVDTVFDDEAEFLESGLQNKGDWRRSNIDTLVSSLWQVAHKNGVCFGVSPAGNLYSLSEGWFADAKKWTSTTGYVDYIIPQLYFGFLNAYCPFEQILSDWESIMKQEGISLFVGISAAKSAMGSRGEEDAFAGTVQGKSEWTEHRDILSRQLKTAMESKIVSGVCVFCYSSLFDPVSGEPNQDTADEITLFAPLLKSI